MTEECGFQILPVHPGLVTSNYGVHEVGVTVCGVQHVLWVLDVRVRPGNRHFPYNENSTRTLNTISLRCLPSTDAIDRREKIHAWVWRFNVVSCKRFNVLYWWGGHCCPMHCDLFKIYCATPNLGISRTWICRLNFAQMPIFSGLRFFNESEISESQLKVPPEGLVLRIFTSWKNPLISAGFKPATLGSRGKHVTMRPPRPTADK